MDRTNCPILKRMEAFNASAKKTIIAETINKKNKGTPFFHSSSLLVYGTDCLPISLLYLWSTKGMEQFYISNQECLGQSIVIR